MFFLGAATKAVATWYYQGKTLGENYTQLLNIDDTFVIQCKGYGSGPVLAQADDTIVSFAVVANKPPSRVAISGTASQTTTLYVNDGILVYDSINGNAQEFAHFLADVSASITTASTFSSSGILSILVPRIGAKDSATFYCVYTDGSASSNVANSNALAVSTPFTLSIRTLRGNKAGRSANQNKFMQYTAAMMAVSKIVY